MTRRKKSWKISERENFRRRIEEYISISPSHEGGKIESEISSGETNDHIEKCYQVHEIDVWGGRSRLWNKYLFTVDVEAFSYIIFHQTSTWNGLFPRFTTFSLLIERLSARPQRASVNRKFMKKAINLSWRTKCFSTQLNFYYHTCVNDKKWSRCGAIFFDVVMGGKL